MHCLNYTIIVMATTLGKIISIKYIKENYILALGESQPYAVGLI